MLVSVTALRQLPGYLLALVYLVTCVVAPSVLLCHGHHAEHVGALGDPAHTCGVHGHSHGHGHTHSDATHGDAEDEPCHTLGGPSHMRAADDLVAAERAELPDLPAAELSGEHVIAWDVELVTDSGFLPERARGPPKRPPRRDRPAVLHL